RTGLLLHRPAARRGARQAHRPDDRVAPRRAAEKVRRCAYRGRCGRARRRIGKSHAPGVQLMKPPALIAGLAITFAALATASPAAQKAEERPALEVGSIPHDELGKDLEGNRIRVSDYRGKVVIVSFW